MWYSIECTDRVYSKGYVFYYSSKNICQNIGKNTTKKISGGYNKKVFHTAKNKYATATDAYKTASGKVISRTVVGLCYIY